MFLQTAHTDDITATGQIFRIGTARYAEGLWRMYGPDPGQW